jgi:hypothetical protein
VSPATAIQACSALTGRRCLSWGTAMIWPAALVVGRAAPNLKIGAVAAERQVPDIDPCQFA